MVGSVGWFGVLQWCYKVGMMGVGVTRYGGGGGWWSVVLLITSRLAQGCCGLCRRAANNIEYLLRRSPETPPQARANLKSNRALGRELARARSDAGDARTRHTAVMPEALPTATRG